MHIYVEIGLRKKTGRLRGVHARVTYFISGDEPEIRSIRI